MRYRIACVGIVLGFYAPLLAQLGGPPQGIDPRESYVNSNIDHTDLLTGNVVVTIPLASFDQLGKLSPLSFSVVLNSSPWSEAATCDAYNDECDIFWQQGQAGAQIVSNYLPQNGSTLQTPYEILDTIDGSFSTDPYSPSQDVTQLVTVQDPTGATHQLLYDTSDTRWARAIDGSGYSVYLPQGAQPWEFVSGSNAGAIVYSPQGIQSPLAGTNAIAVDPDGNSIDYFASSTEPYYYYTDSVGRTIPDPANIVDSGGSGSCPNLGDPNQPLAWSRQWTAPGTSETYTFCFTSAVTQSGFYYGPNGWLAPSTDPLSPCDFSNFYQDSGYTFTANPGVTPPGYSFGACEGEGGVSGLQAVVLPNGTSWKFLYDVSSPYTVNNQTYWTEAYGTIKEIQLPTGGKIDYAFQNVPYPGAFGNPSAYRALRTKTLDDGLSLPTSRNQTSSLTFGRAADNDPTTTETDGSGNQAVHEFAPATLVPVLGNIQTTTPKEISTKYYEGSATNGQLLKEVDTSYIGTDGSTVTLPSTVTTKTPHGVLTVEQLGYTSLGTLGNYECVSQGAYFGCNLFTTNGYNVVTGYYGRPSSDSIFDGAGNLLKSVVNTPEFTQNSLFKVQPALTASTQTNDPGGQVALTNYIYDGGNTSAGIGNLTSVSLWLNTSNSWITTSTSYNGQGMVTQSADPKGNITNINSYQCGGLYPASTTIAYQSSTTAPETTSDQVDCNTGSVLSSTDANGIVTNYTYGDSLGRITRVASAVGTPQETWTTTSYPSMTQTNVAHDQNAKGDGVYQSGTTFDGLGRVIQTQNQNGSIVSTQYDNDGNVYSVTDPHFSGTTGYGFTTYAYDALGRNTIAAATADGTSTQTCYDGIATTGQTVCKPNRSQFSSVTWTDTVDQAGSARQFVSDTVGQLRAVIEPGTNGQLSLETDYSYDGLGNLASVTQHGATGETPRTRTYQYDSLSRMLWSQNSETGVTCDGHGNGTIAGCQHDGYDPNGNLLYKTNANGVTLSYSYDALDRLTKKSYSDGVTPTLLFVYDVENIDFDASYRFTTSNVVGRLSVICTEVPGACQSQSSYSYDALGRLIQVVTNTPSSLTTGAAYTSSAKYDLAGNMTDLWYPSSRHIQQTWDSSDTLISSKLADIGGVVPSPVVNYLSSASYNADGSPNTLSLNGLVQETIGENNRLQVQSLTVAGTSAPLTGTYLAHSYCYSACATGGTANNGNVWGITDTRNGSRTQGFTYDGLNRIASFLLGGAINQQYSIDSFGNLSGVTNGVATTTFDPATNRISNLPCAAAGPTYDAAGNQLCFTDENNAVSQITYDGESRIVKMNVLNSQAPYVSYFYDADGMRIQKANPTGTYTEYLSFGGGTIAERDQNGNWTDYVYANGHKIARVAGTQNVIHFHGNDCSGCNSNWAATYFGPGVGYQIQNGDKLVFKQRQSGIIAGMYIHTSQGGDSAADGIVDQNGDNSNFSTAADGLWHDRVLDLSSFVNQTISALGTDTQGGPPPGIWDVYYADIAIVSTNGVVTPIFNGQPSFSMPLWGPQGESDLSATVEPVTDSSSDASFPITHYYIADHLGSAQMELSAGGWPVWSGQFAPFGQELANAYTPMHYKFTGKERDSESSNDYFGARYYGSTSGRFMSADDGSDQGAADPQSWNLYSYVRNNPLSRTDPDGHLCQTTTFSEKDSDGNVVSTSTQVDHSTCERILNGVLQLAANGMAHLRTDLQAAQAYVQAPRNSNCMTAASKIGATVMAGQGARFGAAYGAGSALVASAPEGEAPAPLAVPAGAALGTGAGVITGGTVGGFAGYGLGWFMCASGGGGGGASSGGGGGAPKKWQITNPAAKIVRGGRTYLKDAKTGNWWSRDTAGHGGSVWKVYVEAPEGLRWIADADEQGNYIVGKWKSPDGMFVRF